MSVPAADNLRDAAKWHGYPTIMREAGAAADLLEAIDELHQPRDLYDGDPYCKSCDEEHPCATARLLHPNDQGGTDG